MGTNVYITIPGYMTKMAAMSIYGKTPSKLRSSEHVIFLRNTNALTASSSERDCKLRFFLMRDSN